MPAKELADAEPSDLLLTPSDLHQRGVALNQLFIFGVLQVVCLYVGPDVFHDLRA